MPPPVADTRIDELCTRVKALERTLTHLLKMSKHHQDVSPDPTSLRLVRTSNSEGPDTANQFIVHSTAQDDLSLSSQVAAMAAFVSRPPSPSHHSGKHHPCVEVLIELPDQPTLQHLFDVYFRHLDNYFPFLDREDVEVQMYPIIRGLGYSAYHRVLVVAIDDVPVLALAGMMLALAECVDSGKGVRDGNMAPGWDRYLQSFSAIHQYSNARCLT